MKLRPTIWILFTIFSCLPTVAQPFKSKVWVADNGDGTYRNPIIYADYSDPDVVRVGSDYYLTASSFNSAPGLPILHSRDLVNWTIIGHALKRQIPTGVFDLPQHGNGVWAPAIRYHRGEFYIFYPDPDFGIYLVKAKNPAGPWSEPHLVKAAKGWIDPCPLWDRDGKAYLVSAFARSRSGIKSILIVSRMSPDGMRLLDEGTVVFDGHNTNPTVEGPKLYQRNGYYYIFAPAGGVENGWQLALRSKHIFGPYEWKVVLAQGKTNINGPHQGAWVDTRSGESWFIHFQDRGPFGRIVHLQPMKWIDDWPVIGEDPEGDGVGQPLLRYRKPLVGRSYAAMTPQDSDEFNDSRLGLQWQWQANPQPNWALSYPATGYLRLFAVAPPARMNNYWEAPNLLLQKFPAPAFSATTKLSLTTSHEEDVAGLIVMGLDYAFVYIRKDGNGLSVLQGSCRDADKHTPQSAKETIRIPAGPVYLRVSVAANAECAFSFSTNGKDFRLIGEPFRARQGRWIGAKVGIFAIGSRSASEMGYADFDWFHVE